MNKVSWMWRWAFFLSVLVCVCGCNGGEAENGGEIAGTVTIFAAASLTDAFSELADTFEAQNPEVTTVLNFAGSQQLAQQLNQGAPADLFASANAAQMEAAVEAGRIEADGAQVFAQNRLVIVFPADNPAAIATPADLAQPNLRLILAASEVPVGQYTLDFLDKAEADGRYGADFEANTLANVVSYEQNVRAVFTKVALGEADAGIVYASDIVGQAAEDVGRIDIPDALNTIARYPIAVLSDAPNQATAAAFIAFVRSSQGQEILATYGFVPAETP